MDYSASLHDADNPAGASPWGSSPGSSPQHGRTTFSTISDHPSSPTTYGYEPPAANNSLSQEHSALPSSAFGQPRTTTSEDAEPDADADESTTEATESQISTSRPPVFGQEQRQIEAPQTLPDQQQPAEQSAPPGQETQSKKPPQPQFRLQAKITGLERTGKKDPILRFDVHVRIES